MYIPKHRVTLYRYPSTPAVALLQIQGQPQLSGTSLIISFTRIRLSFDMINVGNFLNKNWSATKVFSTGFSNGSISFLEYEGLVTCPTDPNVGKPRYSFLYQDAANQIPFVNCYQDNTKIFSRWETR